MKDYFVRSFRFVAFPMVVLTILSLWGCVHSGPSSETLQRKKTANIPKNWRSSVILLENRTDLIFKTHKDGNRVKRKDYIWAYVKKRNPNHMERVVFYDIETYEKPVKIKVKVHYADGSRWTLKKTDIERAKIPFSNAFINEFTIPRYDEGVLIQIETERDYFHPEFIGTFRLRDEYPALMRSISLTFPTDCRLAYGLENPEKAKVETNLIVEDGIKKVEIKAKNLSDTWSRYKTEYPEQWYAALYVSFPPKGKHSYTWRQLGDHYLKLSKEAFASSPEIKALAESVRGTDEKELIQNGFSTIVRKIRYHADEEGRFAFFPRKAATILKHGYGDCKEISTLLKALYQHKQLNTHLAMISTWNYFQPVEKYPSLDNFNHVILAAGGQNRPYQFLDGTHTWASADNSYYHLVGRTAFLIIPGGSRLIPVTAGRDFKSRVTTRSKIKQRNKDGRWTIQGRIELIGYPALRFVSHLNWSDTVEKKSLSRVYLQDEFGIYPMTVDYHVSDNSHVTFAYKASFQDNYVAMGNGGFRLGVPRLFDTAADDSLEMKKGPKMLEPFEQRDTWEFDQPPQQGRLDNFQLRFANCDFAIEDRKIVRTYRQSRTLFQEKDTQLEVWTKHIKSVLKATSWR